VGRGANKAHRRGGRIRVTSPRPPLQARGAELVHALDAWAEADVELDRLDEETDAAGIKHAADELAESTEPLTLEGLS
jgi:hypothetical protein